MLRAVSRLTLVMGSVALGAAGAVALRADLLVGYGFGKALEAQKAALPFELAAPMNAVDKAEVGDEGYWLTRNGVERQAVLAKHLAVGDHITIAGRDGRSRTLEVVDLKSIGVPGLTLAADTPPIRLVRVAARVIGGSDDGRQAIVRFFIEVEDPKHAELSVPQSPVGGT